ncbi:hypothetical protein D0817_23755 [Flavobacterium cupreum]|uniref:Lipoprotein n=1 Tax=Flavobacterium cupreum TaxID=2133766 RepID=A0A434A0Q6_9FLAO|nr:hypothetical protein [Flavobacterium cupreum]RUT67952.1 hypothetical protein D0817_23755 [Flavobacterium cupreum]
MNRKLKQITKVVLCSFILLASGCATDNEFTQQEAQMNQAKNWFDKYDANGANYALFQKMQYNWNQASVTRSEDGTETIIVPVTELKKDQREFWEQKLYIYKSDEGRYSALLFEAYSNKDIKPESQSVDGGDFTGYMTVWDLKKGAVRAAKFLNNQVVEEGVAAFPNDRSKTNKAPETGECIYADFGEGCHNDGGDGTGNAIPLRPVIVTGPSTGTPVIYTPRGPVIGGTTPGGYTSPGGGNGGGGTAPPPSTAINPCDKIKTLLTNANFKAKEEELKKKTNLKVESGYMQSKNGPFTPLTGTSSTENSDQISLGSDANTVGYIHTHLDPYERVLPNGETQSVAPIKMFSPGDVKQFVILLLNASRNNIPIDNIYGTMVSSSSTYQLRFSGNINDVILKGGSINWNGLDDLYKVAMRGNKELGFLKFLNEQIGINGIELYKIEASGNSRKTLDNNGKVSTINCN